MRLERDRVSQGYGGRERSGITVTGWCGIEGRVGATERDKALERVLGDTDRVMKARRGSEGSG